MNSTIKKNKSNDSLIEEYISFISTNCEKRDSIIKKPLKVNDDNFIIPTMQNYDYLKKFSYNISQLKIIANNYKLKKNGNKNELSSRIYFFLYFSSFITKIQKTFRGSLVRKYISLHGPALIDRKICTNTDDFITMEPIEEIKFHNFISYKDIDKFIYGFDISSLYNLFLKSKDRENILNPYNRNHIHDDVFKSLKTIIRLSKIFKIQLNLIYEDDSIHVSNEKAVELRTLALFQNIDALGNYSNPSWFLSLTKIYLIKFLKELHDIWIHRAQLTEETKHKICPPYGDPFRNLNMSYIHTEQNMCNVKKVILEVLEKFVNSGVDADSRTLGAYYVLGALTLVNEDAATSLPWLFQSLNYF
jgi:hypothetical protein